MGLKKLANKVADYNERLESGKADEIKPSHVRQVLKKLQAKQATLIDEMSTATTDDKKLRLERKLKIAGEHIARAEWLLNKISGESDEAAAGQ